METNNDNQIDDAAMTEEDWQAMKEWQLDRQIFAEKMEPETKAYPSVLNRAGIF